jgi:hypothetical protein
LGSFYLGSLIKEEDEMMKKRAIVFTFLLVLAGLSISRAVQKKYEANVNMEQFQKHPVIQNVFQKPPANSLYPHLLVLSGTFFGNTPGSREVRMGSVPLVETAKWEMQQVGAYIPSSVPAGKRYPVCIWDKVANKAKSNLVDFLLKIMVLPSAPSQGPVNSTIILIAGSQNLGSSQGPRKVKFGNVDAQVVSWGVHSISIRVPALNPGKYEGWIEDNGEVVSYNFEFTIL